MTIAHNAIKDISNKLSLDQQERFKFVSDPSKYLDENSLGSFESCDLNNSEYLQTSELCTAVAVCLAAAVVGVVVGAVAVNGVVAALYVAAVAATVVEVAVSSSGR